MRRSDCNPLHLIERDLVASAVVELRRARGFLGGYNNCVFNRAAVFMVSSDTGSPEKRGSKWKEGESGVFGAVFLSFVARLSWNA
jgi:hypothetical protein